MAAANAVASTLPSGGAIPSGHTAESTVRGGLAQQQQQATAAALLFQQHGLLSGVAGSTGLPQAPTAINTPYGPGWAFPGMAQPLQHMAAAVSPGATITAGFSSPQNMPCPGVPSSPSAAAVASPSSWKDELRDLKSLFDDGLLSREDFDREKEAIMAARRG